MFVQVIQGKVKDADAMRAASDRWQKELKPGAKGYLGVTAGVADDGTSITIVRFESEAAAKVNSDRPEQGAWWNEMAKAYDGTPEFYNCPTVQVFAGGGSDAAGFVQVMKYKTDDTKALLDLTKSFESMGASRPDLLGGVLSMADDGTVFDTNYFTSEADARKGEKGEMPADMQDAMRRFGELARDVEYLDIRDPILHS